jgi:hypothetical protein
VGANQFSERVRVRRSARSGCFVLLYVIVAIPERLVALYAAVVGRVARAS